MLATDFYQNYLKPNNLTEDAEYLSNKVITDILKALSTFKWELQAETKRTIGPFIPGIADESGELAASLQEKYLIGAEMGNFESMGPGLTDVSNKLITDHSLIR